MSNKKTRLEEIRERAEWQRRARELDSLADLDRLWLLERVDELEQALEQAVRVRPQLEALVAELDRRIAENDWHPGYRAHLTFARDAILALAKEEK